MREAVSCRNEVGTLLDNGAAGGLVGFVDNESKVLGAHEWWNGGLDEIEALLEPGGRTLQARQVLDLPEMG